MSEHHVESLAGRQVLVTGGTGFIGGRLVARLAGECGARVRVLVRNYARAAAIARFPVELVPGDLVRPADVERAMAGCAVVFHCAYGNQGSDEERRAATVQGTRNVAAAAGRAGVARLVHVSTMAVYGEKADGDLDETRPRRRSGSYYADNKVEAEETIVRAGARDGLPFAIIQPTIVYGPFGWSWTGSVLQQLQTGRVMLIDGGTGLCNAVYVDDVVSALLLAATMGEAAGQTFLISGGEPVTWRAFYARFERMLGRTSTIAVTAAEAEAHYRRRSRRPGLLREALDILRQDEAIRARVLATREGMLAGRLARVALPPAARRRLSGSSAPEDLPEPAAAAADTCPMHPLHPTKIRFLAAKVRVRTDKAARVLGFAPAFDLERGMRLTEDWARWAGLL